MAVGKYSALSIDGVDSIPRLAPKTIPIKHTRGTHCHPLVTPSFGELLVVWKLSKALSVALFTTVSRECSFVVTIVVSL